MALKTNTALSNSETNWLMKRKNSLQIRTLIKITVVYVPRLRRNLVVDEPERTPLMKTGSLKNKCIMGTIGSVKMIV